MTFQEFSIKWFENLQMMVFDFDTTILEITQLLLEKSCILIYPYLECIQSTNKLDHLKCNSDILELNILGLD